MTQKRVFILDTCVLLHDPQAFYEFDEHDIYIPLAVIDDLDELKTRRESVGWYAREVFRILDTLNIKELTGNKGIQINEKGGSLFIYNPETHTNNIVAPISRGNSDNAIIEACLTLKRDNPDQEIVIVTKDTGLRVRAMSYGCVAENYKADLLSQNSYTGIKYIKLNSEDQNLSLWNEEEFEKNDLKEYLQKEINDISPNEFCVFENEEFKCCTIYQNYKFKVLKEKISSGTSKGTYKGIKPKNLEQRLAMEILADDKISLVTLSGKAGCGKTLVSLAVALEKINQGIYKKLIVIKPLIPVGGKDIGALPGSKFEKLSQWLGPIKDNLGHLMGDQDNMNTEECFEQMIEEGLIEAEAMSFIQGRSIPRSIILVDEAENLTPREARMVVERCGKGSKIILLGDLSQVENPFLDANSCGLAHAIAGGKNQELCASVTLLKVERSNLASIATEIFQRPGS